MKHPICSALFATSLLSLPAHSQVPQVVEETVVTEVIPAAPPVIAIEGRVRLDAALARQRLGIAPRALPVEEPVAEPGRVVETTETTTTVTSPGLPDRVYNTQRNVVIVEGRELPYLTLPVLFVEGSAELLDAQSREDLETTAVAIREVVSADPTALFDVEGHTSTDGSDEMNLQLSVNRAKRVYDELTQRYGVPVTALSAHGYGENYPKFPDGTEQQMVQDRRVLVVRVK